MTQLTQQEIEMIEREATELSEHNAHTQRDAWMVYDTCKITATKYLLQLKEERERAGKLFTEDEVCTIYDLFVIEKRQSFRSALQEYKNNNQ